MIEILTGKAMDAITSSLMEVFFGNIKRQYEDLLEQKVLTKASEGIEEEIVKENFEKILKNYFDGLDDVKVYTEDELKQIFDEYYKAFIKEISPYIKHDNKLKEELWKKFLSNASSWSEKYNKSISVFEKRILEKTREIQEDLDKLKRELSNTLESERVADKKILEKLAEYQSELQKRLVQNVDIPYIDFNKLYGVEIRDYESKYVLYENTFDFDTTEDRMDSYEDNIVYIFRFLIKNIGRTNIEKISIENFYMLYAEELWDDNPELGFYVLPIAEHGVKIEKNINILPHGEEFIQLIITKREEELSEQETIENFLNEYQSERLYVTFDMRLKGKEERGYRYILFLSRKRATKTYNDINGVYTMDYSVFMDI